MKKITKVLGVIVITTTLGLTTPVMAQPGDSETSTTQTTDDDNDDDTGKWGLAGLLGLLGLLGLKKNDNDIQRTNRNI